jgi:hypothetical protein
MFEVICKYYRIVYKRLEHPWIFNIFRHPGTNSLWMLRDDYIYYFTGEENDHQRASLTSNYTGDK